MIGNFPILHAHHYYQVSDYSCRIVNNNDNNKLNGQTKDQTNVFTNLFSKTYIPKCVLFVMKYLPCTDGFQDLLESQHTVQPV